MLMRSTSRRIISTAISRPDERAFLRGIPNFRIMEIDIDDVPWKDELVTVAPVIDKGDLLVPTTPGWGADIDEKVLRAHPPRR